MSIQTELSRIINAKAAIKAAIEGKGITVPSGTLLDGMAALIESIQAGGDWIQLGSFILSSDESSYNFMSWSDFIEIIGELDTWRNIFLVYRGESLKSTSMGFYGVQSWLSLNGNIYSTYKGYCVALNISNMPISVSKDYDAISLSKTDGVTINSMTSSNSKLKAGNKYVVEAVVYR